MSTRKTKIIIIVTALFLLVFSTIFASTITHFAPEYAKTTTNVNFRNMPNTNYSSFIRTLKANTNLKIVGSINNYYIVQLETNEVGLVLKDYVNITGEKTNNLVYTDYSPYYAQIKENNTIVRGGPSTSFRVYGKLNSGDNVYIIGKIENFFLVITKDNLVGMIRDDLVQGVDSSSETQNTPNENTNTNVITDSNQDEKANSQYILNKLNTEREKNGLPKFELDSLLNATAQTKAQDMVKNNYFSHTSPTYGTPFEMMQNAGIRYISAGENIAGNTNIDKAIESFLNSEEHSKNILSNAYNYIGIGIEKSDTYGYIIVLMFIGR